MIGTSELAQQMGLHRAGRDWRGDCPLCGYRDAFSMTQREGRALAWCASCQDRDAIAALLQPDGERHHAVPLQERSEDRRKTERALQIWRGALPAHETIAQVYLTASRGLPPSRASSPVLRYRGDTSHPAGGKVPAMLALVMDVAGNPTGIHRTYLARDGRGKANVKPAKASLGPIWGGAIRLDPEAPELVIGEGIETSASAGHLLRLPAWAAISAGNLASGLVLPKAVLSVVIAADPDPPGMRAAQQAAERWLGEGRSVRIARPNGDGDFNDLLLASEAEGRDAP